MPRPQTKTFDLALAQILVEGGRPDANLARAIAAIEDAACNGAEVVLLSEVLDCGWCDRSALELAQPFPTGSRLTQLRQAARLHEIHICAGLTERDDDRIFNSAVLLNPSGDVILTHRKVNELAIGKEIYSTGRSAEAVCETHLGALGVMICSDGFFPGEALTRSLAGKGAQLILSPCAWAVAPDHDQQKEPYGSLWHDVYGRVAREHGIWIAGASNIGEIRHGNWAGHPCVGCSMVVGPEGQVQARGAYREEEIVYTTISLAG